MNERSVKILDRALYELNDTCANLKEIKTEEIIAQVNQFGNMHGFEAETSYMQETIGFINFAIAGVDEALSYIRILKNREEKAHE